MRISRLRSALKPGQDFSRTSRQKTCPYGHKESEDCHSASVPLRCTPSERQSSSHQQYPRLRPGYIKEQRSGDFRLSPPANLANSAILPTAKISTFLCKISLLRKSKDSSWSMPPTPQGRMTVFATAICKRRSPRQSREINIIEGFIV